MILEASPILGTLLHTIGAASAALCYSPQKFLHKWSWQTYWLAQAAVCWLVLPWLFAYLFVPEYGSVLSESPSDAMWLAFGYGVLYGVGGIAFGVAIRYIGFSLTYAIAIGFSCLIGTLFMPLINGILAEKLQQDGGMIVVGGVALGFVAMIISGLAGFRKERELTADGKREGSGFNVKLGLPICVVAGVLSAVFNFSLEAGAPIAEVAAAYGAGNFQELAKYPFTMNGAFLTTLLYVLFLAGRSRSWGEFSRTEDGKGLGINYLLAIATGIMWYLQFFFYGLGHIRMGDFKFSSWAIHMIILILLSSGFGVLIGEWKGARSKTFGYMLLALALLVAAVGLITYGNFLGSAEVAEAGH
ncbi:L-rhamnose/proton symporter RhaT [Pelagicoccus sp. SDUM812005]|uniref:L-rhamnose/proton symporter RhaT n=1 Tax=Pelagicoccus sp. SDUM812005 TaxID=3041257 RepID=UPI00280C45EF|nr:L-rhamnose/proton symporter RhaT [Pelagicoccus sp. SDUM812005]MDQ8179387.1 L-rhamnose/proton symporter RhaT [Pelagicoccus sp. SDUM812005]